MPNAPHHSPDTPDDAGVPRLADADAAALAERLWGLDVRASGLDSYDDQNFRLDARNGASSGGPWVLKVANQRLDRSCLDLENRVMERLGKAGLPVPRIVPTRDGEEVAAAHGHLVRVISWLPGGRLEEVAKRPPDVLEKLGSLAGRVDEELDGFTHPAQDKEYLWDLRQCHLVRPRTARLAGEKRRWVEEIFERFEHNVRPRDAELPRQVIHSDINTANVLVTAGRAGYAISGLLDFGDVLATWTVNELAIAMAYAILDQDDPLAAAAAVVRGYQRRRPLADAELEVLDDLMRTRLAISVTMSNDLHRQYPDNDYLLLNAQPTWAMLDRLRSVEPELALETFRKAL